MSAQRTTWLAWSLGLLCTALAAGSLLFGVLNGTTPYVMLTKDQGLQGRPGSWGSATSGFRSCTWRGWRRSSRCCCGSAGPGGTSASS